MQVILTEEEYTELKQLAYNAESYQSLYNELLSQHLALKADYSKLLVHGVVTNNEKLKSVYVSKQYFNKGFQNNVN